MRKSSAGLGERGKSLTKRRTQMRMHTFRNRGFLKDISKGKEEKKSEIAGPIRYFSRVIKNMGCGTFYRL